MPLGDAGVLGAVGGISDAGVLGAIGDIGVLK